MSKHWYFYVNGLSDLGSRMHLIAVASLVLSFSNSVFWLMAFFVARQIGGILSSVYAGIWADRFDRRRLMIASDVICGASIALIALMPSPYTVVSSAFILGVLYNVFQVSFQASIPEWLKGERVQQNNAFLIRIEAAVGILGFTVGGVLSDQFGYELVIMFDAATFWISAICLSFLRWSSTPIGSSVKRSMWHDLRESASYIRNNQLYLGLILVAFLYALSASSWNYGLPMVTAQFTGQSSTIHGLMWSAIGTGSFIGSVIWSKRLQPSMSKLAGSMALFGLLIILTFGVEEPAVMLLLLILAGVVDAATSLTSRTLSQRAANELRGRVLGLQALFSRCGFLIGFLSAPMIVSHTSLWTLVWFVQMGVVLAAGLVLWMVRDHDRLAR